MIKNFRARLKKADGLFDTLTAITCLIWSDVVPSSFPRSDESSDSVPVVSASNVDNVVRDWGLSYLSTNDKEDTPIEVLLASISCAAGSALLERTGVAVGSSTSNLSTILVSAILSQRLGRLVIPLVQTSDV